MLASILPNSREGTGDGSEACTEGRCAEQRVRCRVQPLCRYGSNRNPTLDCTCLPVKHFDGGSVRLIGGTKGRQLRNRLPTSWPKGSLNAILSMRINTKLSIKYIKLLLIFVHASKRVGIAPTAYLLEQRLSFSALAEQLTITDMPVMISKISHYTVGEPETCCARSPCGFGLPIMLRKCLLFKCSCRALT